MFNERYENHQVKYELKIVSDLRRAFNFIIDFFRWKNIKHAFRSVTGGFKEFSVFFAALFAVQLVFWVGTLYANSMSETAKDIAYSSADCHVIIDGLSGQDKANIENGYLRVNNQLEPAERWYESYYFKSYTDFFGKTYYEMHVTLLEDSRYWANIFVEYYIKRFTNLDDNASVRCTERITYLENQGAQASALKTAFFLVSALIAVIVLTILFNIRTNHYKFTYGIYMSFGAGFEKLFETAAWEMFMISVLTFLPAMGVGCLISFLISLLQNGSFVFLNNDILKALIWSFSVVLLGVFPPVLILSKKRPITLLSAEDGSNLVSSPRRSFFIFGKKFPSRYEVYGMWRFRRYFIGLVIGAVSFSTLFLCGVYINRMQTSSASVHKPQFSFTVAEGVDRSDFEFFNDVDGVEYLLWENTVEAAAIKSHVVLSSSQTGGQSIVTASAREKGKIATNSVKYSLLDPDVAKTVVENAVWNTVGDISSVSSDKYTVAVSEYVYNEKAVKFKPGDKFTIAVFRSQNSAFNVDGITDMRFILEMQLKKFEFDFIEVTVGAVVDNGDTEKSFTVMLNPELYAEVTGGESDPPINKVDVYMSPNATAEDAEKVFSDIRGILMSYDDFLLTDRFFATDKEITERTAIQPVLLIISIVILLLSPLVWFFSQKMFFAKREGEFYILQAVGAKDAQIKELHLFSGVLLAVISFIFSLLLSAAAGYFMFEFVNIWLPKRGFIEVSRYIFTIPIVANIICLIVSVICGFASSFLPYRRYINKRAAIEKKQFGE